MVLKVLYLGDLTISLPHKYHYMSSAHCAFGATGTLPAKGYDSFEAPDFGGLFFAPKWHIEFQYMENRW